MEAELRKLLEKYNIPGPRYTSYPTVPAWSEQVGPLDYQQQLTQLPSEAPLSLYFHLPFCERLCHFCGCMQVITTDHSRSRSYVRRLLLEMKKISELLEHRRLPVCQIHFGGGTPNFLQPDELTELVEAIHHHFKPTLDAEWAIEMHPRTSTAAFCERLAQLNFNRISLGVQDFDPHVQKLIHRDQSYEMTAAMLQQLRDLGFNSFNFDLIYGLPGQTQVGWEKSLDQVLGLKPNRLAVYSYAHVPWVRPVQRSFKDSDLPNGEEKITLFLKAYERLLAATYRPIGMDHFAMAEDELSQALDNDTLHRNFMGYSTRAEAHQLGLGVSSISFVGGHYFQNRKELPAYEAALDRGELATFRGYLLNHEDTLRRDLITQIMCLGRVHLRDWHQKWGVEFHAYFAKNLPTLKPLVDDGLLHLDTTELRAIGRGHLFLRNIAMAFDPYLAKIQKEAPTPVFSKTV